MVIDADEGLVLTNHHVIETAETVTITLRDRRRLDAEVIGSDAATDLALLRVKADRLTDLPLAQVDRLRVGDDVVAIGNPFGLGQSVTAGIVSALGRSGVIPNGYEDFIQTDASINPGNSGGALINRAGELVGINTAIIAPSGGNVGIGFAVPAGIAERVAAQLLRFGEVRRGQLGVLVQDVTPDLAEALGLETCGALISDVSDDSPAARAGLEVGDVVLAVNGEPIDTSSDLRNTIGLLREGTTISMQVVRDGKLIDLEAAVGSATANVTNARQGRARLRGVRLSDGPESRVQYGESGVLIESVDPTSPAADAGLRSGDVIIAANRRRVTTVNGLLEVLDSTDRPVALLVERNERRIYVVLR